jgi:hypothetical protein
MRCLRAAFACALIAISYLFREFLQHVYQWSQSQTIQKQAQRLAENRNMGEGASEYASTLCVRSITKALRDIAGLPQSLPD